MSRLHHHLVAPIGTTDGSIFKRHRWVIFGLLLTSCQNGPATLSDIATSLPSQQVAETGVQLQRPQRQAWWLALNDRQLNQIVASVEKDNLSIAQARERLAAASAVAHSASSQFLPNVGLSGSATGANVKSKVDDISRRPAQLNLETTWEIALFGQDGLARQSADLERQMAAEDVNAAKLSITAEAAVSYVRLRALQHQRQSLDLLSSATAQARNIAVVRSRSGLGTRLEAETADVDSAAVEMKKRTLDSAIADEIQRIAILQGLPDGDAALAAAAPQPVASNASVAQIPADALRQRPDVQRAELAVLKAGAEVGIAEADLYPKLHLSGMIGLGSPVSGSILGVMGGPSLQMPIFDYGKRLDIVEARKAQMREAVAAYRQAVLAAHGEASSALRALNVARHETARAKASHAAARKNLKAAERLAHEGLSDPSLLVTRQIATAEANQLVIQAIRDEAEALIAVARATGGSLTGMPKAAAPYPAVPGRS